MSKCISFKWRTVIVDECTAIKNVKSASWRAIKLLPKQHIGMVSATPAQNRLTDWQAYTLLA
jgi:SNF2 family DNA or RNA helicase